LRHVSASVHGFRAWLVGFLFVSGPGCSSPPGVKTKGPIEVHAYRFHGRTYVQIAPTDSAAQRPELTVLGFLELGQRETWLRFEYEPETREMLSRARLVSRVKPEDLPVERFLELCHALLRIYDCMLVLMLNRPVDPPTWWVVDYRRAGDRGWKRVGP
jgi:hypothetical protein